MIFSSFLIDPKKSSKELPEIGVSVIICAKNEAENLKNFLPTIINQTYPDFEIILINDASSDETSEVMETFAKNCSKIKIITVKNIETFC